MSHQIDTGANHPLGAALAGGRANFSLFSRPATRVESLFFDRADDANPSRVVDKDKQVVDARYKFVRSDAPGSICGNCLLKSRQLSGR